jgi:hypothetical protein
MKNNLFETFERLSLDHTLNFFLSSQSGERIQVEFCRANSKPWTVFLADHKSKSMRNVTRKLLPEVLNAMNSSIHDLEAEVSGHLLMQAGFCDHFIREVTELLGPPAVQQAILGTQRLMDDLTSSVNQILAQPELQQNPGQVAEDQADRLRSSESSSASGSPAKAKRTGRTSLRVIR